MHDMVNASLPVCHPLASKPATSAIFTCNPFIYHTYKTNGLKSFAFHTYLEIGVLLLLWLTRSLNPQVGGQAVPSVEIPPGPQICGYLK
jgi:hypothetical protein